MAATAAEVQAAFEEAAVDLEHGLEAQCVSLGVQYKKTMTDLADDFCIYQHNRNSNDFTLTEGLIEGFRQWLANRVVKPAKVPLADATNQGVLMYTKDDLDVEMPDSFTLSSAAKGRSARPAATPGSVDRFVPTTPGVSPGFSTPGRGGESAWKSPAATYAFAQGCTLEVVGEPLEPDARFMYDRLQDKVAALEARVLAFAEAVRTKYGVQHFHAAHMASQERVVVVGRIVCDAEGRLNERSVLLEGSIKHSAGHRVRLELRDVPSFSLFPGMIVAVEGHNPSGHCLVATRLITDTPASLPRTPEAQMPAQPLSMVVAAGPFCCAEDVEYNPLKELLQYAVNEKADLVVLMGPFVDIEHPAVKSGALDVTFEDLFAQTVQAAVEQACEARPSMKVALVPSTRDVHFDMVFPQPRIDTQAFEAIPGQVQGMMNPATLACNKLLVGAVTHDILKHLSANEVHVSTAKGEDRMARLAGHCIAQRSFYPLYPPPLGACLDTSLMRAAEMAATPDLLLLPSDLSAFAKVLPLTRAAPAAAESVSAPPTPGPDTVAAAAAAEGAGGADADAMDTDAAPAPPAAPEPGTVLCINPGRLTKGNSAGTFVHVHLAAPAPATANGTAPALHDIAKRARVEVVRL